MSELETKNSILEKVIEIIGREGIQGITIRRVASELRINVAAINYHFGSKKNLIDKALAFFGTKTRQVFLILEKKDSPPAKKLEDFVEAFSLHFIQYPGIMKSQMYQVFQNASNDHSATKNMEMGRNYLLKILREICPEDDEETLSMKVFQTMAIVVYPSLCSGILEKIYGFDINDTQNRKKYLHLFIKHSLGV